MVAFGFIHNFINIVCSVLSDLYQHNYLEICKKENIPLKFLKILSCKIHCLNLTILIWKNVLPLHFIKKIAHVKYIVVKKRLHV